MEEQMNYKEALHEFVQKYLLLVLVTFFFGGVVSWVLHSWIHSRAIEELGDLKEKNTLLRERLKESEIRSGTLATAIRANIIDLEDIKKEKDILSLELGTLKAKLKEAINPYDLPKMLIIKTSGAMSVFKGRLRIEAHSLKEGRFVTLSLKDSNRPEEYIFGQQLFSPNQSKLFQIDNKTYEFKVIRIEGQEAVIIISSPTY